MTENLNRLEKQREKSYKRIIQRYDKIEQNVLLKSMERKKNNEEIKEGLNKFRELTYQNRKKLSEEKKKKINDNEKKKEMQNEKFLEKKKKLEEDNLMKKEEERIKNLEKSNLIQRKMRIAEYQNQLRMEELEEKEKKMKEFKNQREKLTQQRIETSIGIQKKKDEILRKFDNLMKQNKEIDPQTIKEVFPDDEELYNKVIEMKKKQKEEEEKIKKQLEEQRNKEKEEAEKNNDINKK